MTLCPVHIALHESHALADADAALARRPSLDERTAGAPAMGLRMCRALGATARAAQFCTSALPGTVTGAPLGHVYAFWTCTTPRVKLVAVLSVKSVFVHAAREGRAFVSFETIAAVFEAAGILGDIHSTKLDELSPACESFYATLAYLANMLFREHIRLMSWHMG